MKHRSKQLLSNTTTTTNNSNNSNNTFHLQSAFQRHFKLKKRLKEKKKLKHIRITFAIENTFKHATKNVEKWLCVVL